MEIQEEVDRIVERSVRPLLNLFIVIFAALAVLTALVGELRRPHGAAIVVALTSASCVALVIARLRFERSGGPPSRSHAYVVGLAILTASTSSVRLYLADEPTLSIAAIVMTVIWSLFILRPGMLIATQLVQIVGWTAAAAFSEAPRIGWIRMGIGVAVAVAIAHVVQYVRIRGVRSDLERRAALTRALAEVEARTAELSAANEALKKSNEELDAFTRTVAHDLKTPLSAVTGYAEMLRDAGSDLDDDERDRLLGIVEATGHKMAEIVDELLLLARVRREPPRREPVDMAAVVGAALERLEYLIDRSGASVELPARWPAAYGYAPWIEAVWTNYLSNATKYGGAPPRIVLGAADEGARVRFWIRDNGVGLRDEERARLFIPFTRLDNERQATGHGLGLSIVRRIIDKLGGEVGVTSTPGEGSEFWFTLPTSGDAREGSGEAVGAGEPASA